MKVLFFNPEQYVDFENEPSNIQLRLPILGSGVVSQHQDFVFQRALNEGGRDAMNSQAVEAYQSFQPDLVVNSLAWWHESLDWHALRDIRENGGKILTIYWDTWTDPLPHEVELLLNSDAILIMDSFTNYLKYRLMVENMGLVTKIGFAPIALHKPIIKPMAVEKLFDITLLGSNEGYRVPLAKFLRENLSNHGIEFNKAGGLIDSEKQKSGLTDNWVPWQEYVRIINQSKICLNSQTRLDRFQIKGKIFDFMQCGTLCLTDENVETRRLIPDDCLVYYSNEQDCLEKILHYLKNDEERAEIETRASAWISEVYDEKSFWRSVVEGVVDSSKDLPKLPNVEEEFTTFKSKYVLVARTQLGAINNLAELYNQTSEIRRLPVRAEGTHRGINILTVGEKWTVGADMAHLDFFESEGKLYTILGDTGIVELKENNLSLTKQHRVFLADSPIQAKQIIDHLHNQSN